MARHRCLLLPKPRRAAIVSQCCLIHYLPPTQLPLLNTNNFQFSYPAAGMLSHADSFFCWGPQSCFRSPQSRRATQGKQSWAMYYLAPRRSPLPNATNIPFSWAAAGMPPDRDVFFCQGLCSWFLLHNQGGLPRKTMPPNACSCSHTSTSIQCSY